VNGGKRGRGGREWNRMGKRDQYEEYMCNDFIINRPINLRFFIASGYMRLASFFLLKSNSKEKC